MGRTLKRVPLDFDWPIGVLWPGYLFSVCGVFSDEEREIHGYLKGCESCRRYGLMIGEKITDYGCPEFSFRDPPKGEGYQLWETTSEGSPDSPVFKTLDELCEWCAENATTFASHKATAEQWRKMLEDDFVYHKEGGAIFI